MTDIKDKPMSAADAASYIEGVTTELADITKRNRLEFLHYLIDMVRQEAAAEAAKAMARRTLKAASR